MLLMNCVMKGRGEGGSYTTLGQSGPGAMSARFAALHSPSRHLVEYTIILQLQCQALEGGRREPVNVPENEGINRHTFRKMCLNVFSKDD